MGAPCGNLMSAGLRMGGFYGKYERAYKNPPYHVGIVPVLAISPRIGAQKAADRRSVAPAACGRKFFIDYDFPGFL